MRTIAELAARLEAERVHQRVTFEDLGQSAGLSRLSTAKVLHGESAARISTVMALADQLGLELVLVPKQIAASLAPESQNKLRPLTRVEQLKRGTSASFVPATPQGPADGAAFLDAVGQWSAAPKSKRTRFVSRKKDGQ